MSVLIVYKPVSEHAREVEEYLFEFERRTSKKLEIVDPETRLGADLCRVYDVVEYPTVLALSEDRQVRNMWRGLPLPLIDEVSYYVQ